MPPARFILLMSRQGVVRLSSIFVPHPPAEKQRLIRFCAANILPRSLRMCNFVTDKEKGYNLVYRWYASLYFIVGIAPGQNELYVLEQIHMFVEVLDRYFGNVCELDIIFNFHKAYAILHELFVGGYMLETNKQEALHAITEGDCQVEEQTRGVAQDTSTEENGLSYKVRPLSARERILDGSVMIYKVFSSWYYNATGTIGPALCVNPRY